METDDIKKNTQNLYIAGVDEVGRGSLAGIVVAAAVILNPLIPLHGIADSKKLGEVKRNNLATLIKEFSISWFVASASVEEIDEHNILQATLLAMQRAVNGLHQRPDQVLVDGIHLPLLSMPAVAIVKGDSKVQAISAASILAKVERDRIMVDCHKKHPHFSFHKHKGYGTVMHLSEIEQYGILELHRKTFNPVKSIIENQG